MFFVIEVPWHFCLYPTNKHYRSVDVGMTRIGIGRNGNARHGLSDNKQAIPLHYDDVIVSAIASQVTSLASVYSAVSLGADFRKHQSSASLAFVRRIYRGPVNSPHKWPVTRKMFPFDDVIMWVECWIEGYPCRNSSRHQRLVCEYVSGNLVLFSICLMVLANKRRLTIYVTPFLMAGTVSRVLWQCVVYLSQCYISISLVYQR